MNTILFAKIGLMLWFERMVPTLLPFMILSGLFIKINISDKIVAFAKPLLKALYKLSDNGCYCFLCGYLFGFPMGAKIATDLYCDDKITYKEAEYLTIICNNLSPAYLYGFAIPFLNVRKPIVLMLILYLVPLIYGFLLRRITYKNISFQIEEKNMINNCEITLKTIIYALDECIISAAKSIITLGGYMIFFNMINVVFIRFNEFCRKNLSVFLEISGGLNISKGAYYETTVFMLGFGGLSCIAQTASVTKKANINIYKYVIHKIIISVIFLFVSSAFSSFFR